MNNFSNRSYRLSKRKKWGYNQRYRMCVHSNFCRHYYSNIVAAILDFLISWYIERFDFFASFNLLKTLYLFYLIHFMYKWNDISPYIYILISRYISWLPIIPCITILKITFVNFYKRVGFIKCTALEGGNRW